MRKHGCARMGVGPSTTGWWQASAQHALPRMPAAQPFSGFGMATCLYHWALSCSLWTQRSGLTLKAATCFQTRCVCLACGACVGGCLCSSSHSNLGHNHCLSRDILPLFATPCSTTAGWLRWGGMSAPFDIGRRQVPLQSQSPQWPSVRQLQQRVGLPVLLQRQQNQRQQQTSMLQLAGSGGER